MRIACGGRWLCMAQQLADDGQSKAQSGANARMSVAEVMDAQAGQAGPFHDRSPRPVQIGPRLVVMAAGGVASDRIGADALQISENVEGRGIQHDSLLARLAVWQNQQPAL